MHKSHLPLPKPALAALAFSLALAGCATTLQPPVPEAEPQIEPTWKAPEARAAGGAFWPLPEETASSDTVPVVDSVSAIGWRDFFSDPKLKTLIELALENNRDLRSATLNVERARALYRIQRADRLPSINASASLSRSGGETAPEVEQYQVELGLAQFELDLFGRVRSLSDAALQEFFATEEARRSLQLSLISEVASAYLALAADLELERIAQATLANFEEEFALTQRRHELGAVSNLDLSQARTIVASARADAALFAGQVAQDVNALNLLVGSTVGAELLPEQFDLQVSGISALPSDLPSEVLLRRPDILQSERELLAANASIGAARAAFFPSISLTAAVGVASSDLSDLFGDGTGIWSFYPRINLPIFQGGRLRANRDAAIAARDAAVARYERSIQSGFREVADSLALSWTLADRRRALEEMVQAASETQALSETRYRSGRDSYLILLDAQRTLYSARQALVQTQLREQINRVTLYRALGGGWKEDT